MKNAKITIAHKNERQIEKKWRYLDDNRGVMVLAVTYVLSLSLFFFCVRMLLIDYHYHSSSS
jgi:hypothetical protein